MPASRAHDGGGGSHPAQSSCVRLTESTCTRKEALMVVLLLSFHAPQQWHLASLTGPGFFRAHPELPQSSLFRLSLCVPALVLSLGLTSEAQASARSRPPHLWMSVSGWGVQGSCTDCLCRALSVLPSTNWLLRSPRRLQSSPSVQADLPDDE